MKNLIYYHIAFLLYLALFQASSYAESETPPPSLRDLIDKSVNLNSALSGKQVEVKGSADLSVWNEKENRWESAQWPVRFSANYKGFPPSAFYVSLDPFLSPWKNGSADFFASRRDIAYNGKFISEIITKEGPPDKMDKCLYGSIRDYKPEVDVEIFRICGIEFLLSNIRLFNGSMLEALDVDKLSEFQVTDSKNGSDTVEYIRKSKGLSEKLAIDINRGNSLTMYEYETLDQLGNSVGSKTTYTINELKQISENLYYPVDMEYLQAVRGVPRRRWRVKVDSVEIVADSQIPKPYVISFPLGTKLTDERLGVSFIVGPSQENIGDSLQIERPSK